MCVLLYAIKVCVIFSPLYRINMLRLISNTHANAIKTSRNFNCPHLQIQSLEFEKGFCEAKTLFQQ